MAYVDLGNFGNERNAVTASRRELQPLSIDPLDLAAVRLGSADGLETLRDDGFWARSKLFLFGLGTSHGLADPSLEAIRRLTVLARLGHRAELSRELAGARRLGVNPFVISWIVTRFGRSSMA